jgi:hypothetical protein
VIERAILHSVAAVVVITMLAAVLPKLTTSIVALSLVAMIGRCVWWLTR